MTAMVTATRKRDYPIIRFLIGSLYAIALVMLLGGLSAATYLWIRAEALRDGMISGGLFASELSKYDSGQLYVGAAVAAGGGLIGFLVLGAIAQFLAIQRDQGINAWLQVQLLEDILELNEQLAAAAHTSRVELCDGCGRLGALHRIESGQWICRECRRQLRSA